MIAGQLTGTLFNTEAAEQVAAEAATQEAASTTIRRTAKSARDMALHARIASRAMQALPTQVPRLEPHAPSLNPSTTIATRPMLRCRPMAQWTAQGVRRKAYAVHYCTLASSIQCIGDLQCTE